MLCGETVAVCCDYEEREVGSSDRHYGWGGTEFIIGFEGRLLTLLLVVFGTEARDLLLAAESEWDSSAVSGGGVGADMHCAAKTCQLHSGQTFLP
jgi:hypothetical protein